jgi:hypothetical protein
MTDVLTPTLQPDVNNADFQAWMAEQLASPANSATANSLYNIALLGQWIQYANTALPLAQFQANYSPDMAALAPKIPIALADIISYVPGQSVENLQNTTENYSTGQGDTTQTLWHGGDTTPSAGSAASGSPSSSATLKDYSFTDQTASSSQDQANLFEAMKRMGMDYAPQTSVKPNVNTFSLPDTNAGAAAGIAPTITAPTTAGYQGGTTPDSVAQAQTLINSLLLAYKTPGNNPNTGVSASNTAVNNQINSLFNSFITTSGTSGTSGSALLFGTI